MKDKGILKNLGGRGRLTDLINSIATASNVVSHAKLVKNKSILRRLIGAASEVVAMGYE
ncbi:MAG: replicative DNA helicase, partial [Acidobacteria bacterium]